ncbi:MAG: hypothetical protein H6Q16_1233 [Bacteroidetes bacterium]|nr:hypothetical protein [Bacteroidota bacterium]
MSRIEINEDKNNVTTGSSSNIINGINIRVDLKKKITNFYKKKSSWVLTGLILPIITGLIVEIFSSGSLTKFFKFFIDKF